jgi:serine/threonine-protein kinase
VVYLAETMSQQLIERAGSTNVVIKEIRVQTLSPDEILEFRQEISILWLLRKSPYTCKIVGYSQNPYTIIMPYYEYGTLGRMIYDGFPTVKSRLFRWMSGIAQGLDTIHKHSIAHLDLKPGNILMDMRDGQLHPVITDFGISAITSDEILLVKHFRPVIKVARTVSFCAPEIFRRSSKASMLLSRADIYSFGIVILAMLNRETPWSKRKL